MLLAGSSSVPAPEAVPTPISPAASTGAEIAAARLHLPNQAMLVVPLKRTDDRGQAAADFTDEANRPPGSCHPDQPRARLFAIRPFFNKRGLPRWRKQIE